MNSVSRRDILKQLLVVGGVGLTPSLLATENALVANNTKEWHHLQASQLQSLVGGLFSAHGEQASCDMILKDVHISDIDLGRPTKLARSQGYTATFTPLENHECFQNDQILELIHPDISGDGQLYVSMKRDKQEASYMEIVFN